MKTLNVIGAGRVGRTLARLWKDEGVLLVQDVLDGTREGAESAIAFIGGGNSVGCVAAMRAADLWMLTTPDRLIAPVSESLAASHRLRCGDCVFHCSGSMSSSALAAAMGGRVASVHPLKSFADPNEAVRTFAGTYCAAEGDADALTILGEAFARIGGRVSEIDARQKTLYHAASVIVCNDLTALMETGLRCYEEAGIARDTASSMIEPMVRETIDNVFRLGTQRALTGPIARADEAVVVHHLDVLSERDPLAEEIYRRLGLVAVELARGRDGWRDGVDAHALERIAALLRR